jgi:hypothetical protein
MSPEEINSQAGKVAREYSEAKAALGQSEHNLASIASDYEKTAQVLRSYSGEQFTSANQIIEKLGSIKISGLPVTVGVVGGDRLVQLLREHEDKKRTLSSLLETLKQLGLANLS